MQSATADRTFFTGSFTTTVSCRGATTVNVAVACNSLWDGLWPLNMAGNEISTEHATDVSFAFIYKFEAAQNYSFHFSVDNLPPLTAFTLDVEILELDVDIDLVTAALMHATEDETRSAVMSAAVSEAMMTQQLRFFLRSTRDAAIGQVGQNAAASLGVLVQRTEWQSYDYSSSLPSAFPTSPLVTIDVENESITAQLTVTLTVDLSGTIIATVYLPIKITCDAAVVTRVTQDLQVAVTDVAATAPPEVRIHDDQPLESVFGSRSAFEHWVQDITNSLGESTSAVRKRIALYAEALPLPSLWKRTVHFDATFLRFKYVVAHVHGKDVNYIVALFSVRSRSTPVPCHCQTESIAVPPTRITRVQRNIERNFAGIQESGVPFRRLWGASQVTKTSVVAAWEPYFAEAALCVVALSEKAIAEIGQAYGNAVGDEGGDSTGGDISAEYQWWYHLSTRDFQIQPGKVTAQITLTSSAEARVIAHDGCGDEVASVGVGISIAIRDSSVELRLAARSIDLHSAALTADSTLNFGHFDIEFDVPLVWPADQMAGWITSKVADTLRASIAQQIPSKMHFDVIMNHSATFRNYIIPIETRFIPRSAIAQLVSFNFGL